MNFIDKLKQFYTSLDFISNSPIARVAAASGLNLVINWILNLTINQHITKPFFETAIAIILCFFIGIIFIVIFPIEKIFKLTDRLKFYRVNFLFSTIIIHYTLNGIFSSHNKFLDPQVYIYILILIILLVIERVFSLQKIYYQINKALILLFFICFCIPVVYILYFFITNI